MSLRVGDWVRVRSEAEILSTLDNHGRLDGLSFMPQMQECCGKAFRVRKSAHKLCDTVTGTGARRMEDAVFLTDARCDGKAFGGCEMECPIVWKEAWITPIAPPQRPDEPVVTMRKGDTSTFSEMLRRCAQPADKQNGDQPIYSCQATQMPYATTWISVWDLRQYIQDFRSGNATLQQILSVLGFLIYDNIAALGLGFGTPLRSLYDRLQKLRGGAPYPCRPGKIPLKAPTPSCDLGLLPGEVIRVKLQADILETVTEDLVNRGMSFHPDMVPHCDRTFTVSKRLARLINEKTGQLVELKNECVVLEGVKCTGRFTKPLLCPRGMSPYWRGIWLERIDSVDSRSNRD